RTQEAARQKPQNPHRVCGFLLLQCQPSLGSSCVCPLASEPASTYLPLAWCRHPHARVWPCKTFERVDPMGQRTARSLLAYWSPEHGLEALLVSTGVVALAEIGDKTQLLAFM